MTDNVATIATAIERLNAGDIDGYMGLYRLDAAFSGYPSQFEPTFKGVIPFYRALLDGVPDLHVVPLDVLIDADRVAVRYRVTGSHKGELFGAPATGNAVDIEGLTIMRFDGDLVAHRWNRLDELTFFTQVGLLPSLG